MKTTIFKYKEYIGIMSNPNAEGFVTKPENGSFGCVLDASKVEISEEALKTLKEIPRVVMVLVTLIVSKLTMVK
jgi:hypothetical protein